MATASYQAYLDSHQQQFVAQLLEFLRIPSISTDVRHQQDVFQAAEWTASRLRTAGMDHVQLLGTTGNPVVYADWLHAPCAPTILFYAHYDVQPVDPLELWTSPPFEPKIENGRVYARGASDTKANVLIPIIACEALLQTTGALPVNVKFLFEGEEEIGSPSLESFLRAHEDLLACELAISSDGGIGSRERPVINTGLRGLVGLQIRVQTANRDIHSGYGGLVPNPLHALVRILDSLRDDVGRVQVPGFYDDVEELTDAERAFIAQMPLDVSSYMENLGIVASFGEPEFTPAERVVARPTMEINGMWGGFQGEGVKTVIPYEAFAKLTCRLVPGQTPEKIRQLLRQHILAVTPAYAEVFIEDLPGVAYPYRLSQDHFSVRLLQKVLSETTGHMATLARGGGTVPIMGMLQTLLGVETLTVGASGADEQAHAPNEFVRLDSFTWVQQVYCKLLHQIAQGK